MLISINAIFSATKDAEVDVQDAAEIAKGLAVSFMTTSLLYFYEEL